MLDVTYLGIDPSLTATGYAILGADGAYVTSGVLKTKPAVRGPSRLAHIRDRIKDVMPNGRIVVAMEGYAMGAHAVRFGRGMSLAELHGVVRVLLWECGRAVTVVVPPSSLKKYATGNGTAKKGTMEARASAVFGFDPKDDNEADALHLARMARDWWTGAPVPADYREGMKKIESLYAPPFDKVSARRRTRRP